MVMPLYFMVVGLALQPLGEIFPGLAALIREPDFLITDYFVIGGVGAAFMNAGLLTMLLLWPPKEWSRYSTDSFQKEKIQT